MNEKMEKVRKTIHDNIEARFPMEYLAFVFHGKIKIEDIILQIMMECCKYAHDTTSEKHSIRYYLQQNNLTEDDQRMVIQRVMQKINLYKETVYNTRKKEIGIDIEGLRPKDMDSIESKLAGYEINEFQFWEILNVRDLRLIDNIISGQIFGKNYTNGMFKNAMSAYDKVIEELILKINKSSKETVFASLALFVLEWSYSVDFYYKVAEEMESKYINEIDNLRHKCNAFSGVVGIQSYLNYLDRGLIGGDIFGYIHTESRMLLLRDKFVGDFVSNNMNFRDYLEAIVIVFAMLTRMTYQGINIREWFAKNTDVDDWASVMREYDVSKCFVDNKLWTNKRIRYVKQIYETTHTDYKKS